MTFNERLIEFWNHSKEGRESTTSGMWKEILKNHHQPLISSLESGDPNRLQQIFDNLGWGCHGIENPEIVAWGSGECNKYMSWLAQRVGLESCRNPEQPIPGNALSNYKSELENNIGLKFDPPSCFQYDCSKGIPARFVYSFSSGFTIKHILRNTPKSFLEIGAGMGWMGYVVNQWDCKYTVIDLPSIAIFGAYFMSKVCGEENVWLYGEPENHASARFFPSTHFSGALGKYDVVYNSDSLPEMTPEARAGYMALIPDLLSDNGIFLSINHEAYSRVYDYSNNLHLVFRGPFMMRAGYLEEIYTKA